MNFRLWLETNREDQYNYIANTINALRYSGINVIKAQDYQILTALKKLGKLPKEDPSRFLAQLRMVATGSFVPDEDFKARRKQSLTP